MITVTNATYRIPSGKAIVDSVSVTIDPGSVLGVLGPNGAGKSTLLKMLSADISPCEGSVELDSRSIRDYDSQSRALRIAVLPQSAELSFPYHVFDVALFGRLPHHRASNLRKDRAIVWECLERVEADHLAERSFQTLSGGEKQRVQLARVLAQLEDGNERLDGKVLLLDEPTSALDLSHQHQVLSVAKDVSRRGAAVLAILHDLNLAAQYSDQLMVLHEGKSVAQGCVDEVLTPDLVEHVYNVRADIRPHPLFQAPFVCTAGRCFSAQADGEDLSG